MPATARLTAALFFTLAAGPPQAHAYPPAVGILTNQKNCLACHANNGPWKDDPRTIIDILDQDTMKSLKQTNGSFLIETKRGRGQNAAHRHWAGQGRCGGSALPQRVALR